MVNDILVRYFFWSLFVFLWASLSESWIKDFILSQAISNYFSNGVFMFIIILLNYSGSLLSTHFSSPPGWLSNFVNLKVGKGIVFLAKCRGFRLSPIWLLALYARNQDHGPESRKATGATFCYLYNNIRACVVCLYYFLE